MGDSMEWYDDYITRTSELKDRYVAGEITIREYSEEIQELMKIYQEELKREFRLRRLKETGYHIR